MTPIKTILITGATGLLGRQLVLRFIAEGNIVVATSRKAENLASLEEQSDGLPGRMEGVVIDLVRRGGRGLVEELSARKLRPDAIVNNAVDLSNQPISADGHPREDQWQTEFQLAVVIPYDLVMGFAESADSQLTAVVNIASMYGIVPRNPSLYEDPQRQSPIHYGVAKAAMIHLTKELAIRLAPRVRVNAVAFGGVEGRVDDAFKTRYAKLAPMGRMLRDNEVAAPVAFLLSEGASMMTGHTLVVDGGWTTW